MAFSVNRLVLRGCLLLGAGLLSGACSNKPTPAPERSAPPASASQAALAISAAPSASAAPARSGPVTMVPEPFSPGGEQVDGLYEVEGSLLVSKNHRVGRLDGEKVTWISDGKIPPRTEGIGDTIIQSVHGRWPDHIEVLYTTNNGRSLQPTYVSVVGKGSAFVVAPGASGHVSGVATAGETTFLSYWDFEGQHMAPVHGPKAARFRTPAAKECKEKDSPDQAVIGTTYMMGGTAAGTLIAVGMHCAGGVGAEIWDKEGKSRIVRIKDWKEIHYPAGGLRTGNDEELWFYGGPDNPILLYKGGEFTALPRAPGKLSAAFVSPTKQLHAGTDQGIFRLEGGRWEQQVKYSWPTAVRSLATDGKTFWGVQGGLVRLKESEDIEVRDGCKTPFVLLYDVSPKSEGNYTFPSTRKALSTFAEVEGLKLADFVESGVRRLGVAVSSKAQGEALVAHVKATMKDEAPRLICYAPGKARTIPIQGKP